MSKVTRGPLHEVARPELLSAWARIWRALHAHVIPRELRKQRSCSTSPQRRECQYIHDHRDAIPTKEAYLQSNMHRLLELSSV